MLGQEGLFVGVSGPGLMFAAAEYLVLLRYLAPARHDFLPALCARLHARGSPLSPADLKQMNYDRSRCERLPIVALHSCH